MVNSILDGIIPAECRLCRSPSRCNTALCADCEEKLMPIDHYCRHCALPLEPCGELRKASICPHCLHSKPPFERIIAPWVYDEHMAFLVKRWKFHGEHGLTSLFARLWLDRLTVTPAVDALVPVPLHWSRLWQRGFNQSHLLCHKLQRHIAHHQIQVEPPSLKHALAKRVQKTGAQSGLSAADRRQNLHGAFAARADCTGLRLAIVDDIVTTGVTAAALTQALLAAGAQSVEVWSIARTPAPPN